VIVSTPILHALALGAARIVPEQGDTDVHIPSEIYPCVDLIAQTAVQGAATNVEADNSLVLSAASNIPASTIASTVTACTLKKGVYTIDLQLSARFVGTPAPSGVMDTRFTIVDEALTNEVTLLGLFAQTLTAQTINRRFRVALPGTYLIRRRTEATGVGQTMEIGWSLSIERHL